MYKLVALEFVVFSLFLVHCDAQGKYPCHAGRDQLGAAGCTEIILPHDLCTKCPLNDVYDNGDFKDCKSIYNIDFPGCQGQLIEFVNMNWCDWRRAEQVDQWINGLDQWTKNQAKEKLDYFVYALCKECCDCIPISSANLDHSVAQQNEESLYHYSRGNCAAHVYYDICQLLPDIKGFTNPGEEWISHEDKPNICWPLNEWFQNNQNWGSNHNTYVSPDIENFLNNVNRKIKCGSENTWTKCKDMEIKQGNLGPVELGTSPLQENSDENELNQEGSDFGEENGQSEDTSGGENGGNDQSDLSEEEEGSGSSDPPSENGRSSWFCPPFCGFF